MLALVHWRARYNLEEICISGRAWRDKYCGEGSAYVFAVEGMSLGLLLFGMICKGQVDGRQVRLLCVCPWESDTLGSGVSASKNVDIDAANVILATSKRAGGRTGIAISVSVQCDDFRANDIGSRFDVARNLNSV